MSDEEAGSQDEEKEEVVEKSDESEEEEPQLPKDQRELIKKSIKDGLSQISKTSDNDGYAFSKLNLAEKEIRKLFRYLRQYPHLKYLDASINSIRDISILANIPYLLTLDLFQNKIEHIDIFCEENNLTFLQKLNLQTNRVRSLPALKLPMLRILNL